MNSKWTRKHPDLPFINRKSWINQGSIMNDTTVAREIGAAASASGKDMGGSGRKRGVHKRGSWGSEASRNCPRLRMWSEWYKPHPHACICTPDAAYTIRFMHQLSQVAKKMKASRVSLPWGWLQIPLLHLTCLAQRCSGGKSCSGFRGYLIHSFVLFLLDCAGTAIVENEKNSVLSHHKHL